MRTVSILLIGALLVLGVARADSCPTTEPTATLDTPEGTYYVVNDACQPDCLFSIWVYEESNGEPGLQRPSEFCGDDGYCCHGDTIIV